VRPQRGGGVNIPSRTIGNFKSQSARCVQDRHDPVAQARGEPVRRQFDCSELLAPIREILY
jgi:hypothetical protein